MADVFSKGILKIVVAQLTQAVGFDSLQLGTLEVLTDLLERFLLTTGRTAHDLSEKCGRTNVMTGDIEHCFNLLHISPREIIDYVQQMDQVQFPSKVAKFPIPKSSNFQFQSIHESSDSDIPSYFPSLKQSAAEEKPLNTSDQRSRSPLFTIAGKDASSDESAADGYASDGSSTHNAELRYLTNPEDIPVVSGTAASSSPSLLSTTDYHPFKREVPVTPPEIPNKPIENIRPKPHNTKQSLSKNDEPLWVKQHAARMEHQTPKSSKSFIKSTSTPVFPNRDSGKQIKHETPAPKVSPWDSPLFSNPKLLSSKSSDSFKKSTPKDKFRGDFSEKTSKPKKTSITSRIAEVDKLLHDPLVVKEEPTPPSKIKLEKSPMSPHYNLLRAAELTKTPIEASSSNNSALFASPKSMDDAIDAVVHRASKEVEEAELMKFSHLVKDSSSSGEDCDVEVSHKTEELLQLEQRGFHHHHEEESPVRPPLTPSPAPSNTSMIIDQDIDFNPGNKSTYRDKVPSLLVHTPEPQSERKHSVSSHSSVVSHDFHDESHDVYDSPHRKHSREIQSSHVGYSPPHHKKSKKDRKDKDYNKVKSLKKSKHKDKEKKRSTSHEPHKLDLKAKSVEKLVLKKSKFIAPKVKPVVKEREVVSCSFQRERLPLPKLSAEIPAPLIINKDKKKEKKEKKKKKEKEIKLMKHTKEEVTPIPKLTFKMTTSDKKVSIVKPSKHKRTPSLDEDESNNDLDDEDLYPPPPKKKAPEVKKEQKPVERKLITQTISVGHAVGVVLDDDGNRVWICPGCNKPDDGSPMIGCDKCDDWYHWPCVGIIQEPPENEEWFCPNCRKAQKQKGKKKIKTKHR
ncbi:uncharacterized protein LOC100175083 [Ciona intestinalis]